MIGTYSNKTTNTFRIVNNVLFIIGKVTSIIATVCGFIAGVILLIVGILAINGQIGLPEEIINEIEHAAEAQLTAGSALAVIGGATLAVTVFLFIPLCIFYSIVLKQNKRPEYSQFIGVAIGSFIFGEYVSGVFSIIIYIIEKRNASRSKVIEAEVK